MSKPCIHRFVLSLSDGNFWDLKDREASLGLHKGVVSSAVLLLLSAIEEHEQHEREELGFNVWIGGFVLASFLNETIPLRQSGHGIEPGGPLGELEVLLVEHRYKAHRVHSSCKQPDAATVHLFSKQTAQGSSEFKGKSPLHPHSRAILTMLISGRHKYGERRVVIRSCGGVLRISSSQSLCHERATAKGLHPFAFLVVIFAPLAIRIWQHCGFPPYAA